MSRHLAPGMLASLAIEQMAVAADTPIDRLIDFRERHRDELALFRGKVEELAASIDTDLPAEALRARVADLHANEVAPAIANLKGALNGQRIKCIGTGLLAITVLPVGTSTMLGGAGMNETAALLASVGLTLTVFATSYNADRRQLLRANPYTYLLSVKRELA